MKRLIGWILSKMFPYQGCSMIEDPIVSTSDWDKCKLKESEEFYGGQDGTGRY